MATVSVSFSYEHLLGAGGKGKVYGLTPFKYGVTLAFDAPGLDPKGAILLSASGRGGEREEIEFAYDDKRAEARLGVNRGFRRGAKLCVTAYALTKSDLKAECLQRVGVCRIDLFHALSELSVRPEGESFSQRKSLVEFQSDAVKKRTGKALLSEGRLGVTFSMGAGDSRRALRDLVMSAESDPEGEGDLSEDEWRRRMVAVCVRGFRDIERSRLVPALESICPRIRCPEFMLPPSSILPGGAYCAYGKPPSGFGEPAFRHFRDVALETLGFSRASFSSWVSSRESFLEHHRSACLVLVETVSRFAWSLQYIADFTNSNASPDPKEYDPSRVDDVWNETFKNPFRCECGDCEDLAWTIHRLFEGLVDECEGFEEDDLRRFGALAGRYYVSVLPQCIASHANVRKKMSAEGGRAEKGERKEDQKAKETRCARTLSEGDGAVSHTLCLLVPKRVFRSWLENGRGIYEDMLTPVGNRWKEVRRALDLLHPEPREEKESALNVLCCEGTYPTHPLHPSELTHAENRSMDLASRVLSNDEGLCETIESVKPIEADLEKRFCKMMVRGFTECLRRHGLPSLNVCFLAARGKKRTFDSYGVWSENVLRRGAEGSVGCFFYCFMEGKDLDYVERSLACDPATPSFRVPTPGEISRQAAYGSVVEALSSVVDLERAGDAFEWGEMGPDRTCFFAKSTHKASRLRGSVRRLVLRCMESEGGLRVSAVPVHYRRALGSRPLFLWRIEVSPQSKKYGL